MKTSYFQKRSSSLLTSGRVAVLVAVLFLLVLFILRVVFPTTFFSLVSPIFSFGTELTSLQGDVESDVARADRTLMNENNALQARVKDLERLAGVIPVLEEGIVASVIARPPLAPYDSLLVYVGKNGDVVPGMQVSAEGGVPIGTVEQVTDAHAQIALYSTAGRMSEGWAGENRHPVTLEGVGAGAFTARVPRDAELSEGDYIYLPGPGARPVGRIVHIDADPSSPSAQLRIEPLVNLFSLVVVRVEHSL